MSWESKVIWSEGMFLQPQHFQQHERYLENLIEARARPARSHGWGFLSLQVDQSALAMGKVTLSTGSGLFPDGTPFDFPFTHAAPIPLNIPASARDQLIMLAVPMRRKGFSESDAAPDGNGRLARYDVTELEVTDSSSHNAAPIQVGQMRLSLLLESERTDAYACLGVLRLSERRADNQLLLDKHYIPPSLTIRDNAALAGFCNEIYGLLHQRGEELAAQLSQPGRGGVAEIADFMLLQAVNRHEPLFAHYCDVALFHPEQLFVAMLSLAGDLSTFSRESRRPENQPAYQHDNLERTFAPLMNELRSALSMVLHRSAVPIDLQDKKYGVRLAQLPDRDLLKSAGFVLAVNAKMPSETLRARFPGQVKIGPVERIRDLVNLALPGIPLHSMPVAPRQIPYHAGFHYFEVERGGELWDQLERSGGLAMHIAGEFPGLELEFWAIKG
ncbi:type VI secretion system protein ImpJ [Duganella sp. CF458]|uniref:type VI secretion system baseplate subunit TssK n=1 Tax=Duganella sp. CF458 TaxID=1884368 RepID=UPI0008E28D3E|nr:type VI secretion system baseplate subunit TssK [Duganella sp. CF458]SFG09936.1 type VI secretion system protein ImpJ [Duganella sp. CF458]